MKDLNVFELGCIVEAQLALSIGVHQQASIELPF